MIHLVKYVFQIIEVFDMIARINWLKTLVNHVSCSCKEVLIFADIRIYKVYHNLHIDR